MKRGICGAVLWGVLAVLLIAGGCRTITVESGQSSGVGTAVGEPYRIGALCAITGPASSLGLPQRDTIKLLQAAFDAAGGVEGDDGLMHPVEITVYDTESDETKAVLATKKLIEEDNVSVIIGPSQSGTTLALIDTVQKAEIPLVSSAASIQIVEPVAERAWVFKTAPADRLVVAALLDYLKGQGIREVAWISVNTAYGDSGKVEFEAAAPAAGIEIVTSEKFEATDTDMTAQLTKVRGTSAQALVIWAIPPAASAITKNAHDLGMTLPIYHSHGIANATFIELASAEAAEGTRFPVGKIVVAADLPEDDPQKEVLMTYLQDYQTAYDAVPSTFGGHAWDGIHLAVQVMQKVGNDRAAIREGLEATTGFVGIGGVFNFSPSSHEGLGTDALAMVEIRDGKWRLVESGTH